MARIDQCREVLEKHGFRATADDNVTDKFGYLAGSSDQARADAFMRAFTNSQVKGVICAKGGYGAMRILPLLDWGTLKENPKFFCGFSDITALHMAFRAELGLVTYHGGPMPRLGDEASVAWNDESFFGAMTGESSVGIVSTPQTGPAIETLVGGQAEGIIDGGNLTLLASLTGTRWQMNFADKIMLVEDVSEVPYRIDRSLTQLELSGALEGVRGIVFGDSPTCEKNDEDDGFTLREVIMDRLGKLGVPLIYGYPCGHTTYRVTVPLGVPARLNADSGILELLG